MAWFVVSFVWVADNACACVIHMSASFESGHAAPLRRSTIERQMVFPAAATAAAPTTADVPLSVIST